MPYARIAITLPADILDRKSTRLNSSHSQISYAVFCLKKKKTRFVPVNVKQYSTTTVRRPYYLRIGWATEKLRGRVTRSPLSWYFFFNDTATTEIYTLSLHDALPI